MNIKNRILFFSMMVLLIFLVNCGQSVRKIPDTDLAQNVSTLEYPSTCSKIDITTFEETDPMKNTHLAFLGWNNDVNKEQVWIVSMWDGSLKMIYNEATSPYDIGGISLLNDGHHLLLFGADGPWLSDIEGSMIERTDSEDYLTEFPMYSDAWNILARSIKMEEGYWYYQGQFGSPDGNAVAVWQYGYWDTNETPTVWHRGDEQLVITDQKAGKEISVLNIGEHDSITGNWSPDGKQFVFFYYHESYPGVEEEEYYSQLYIVNSDGNELRKLTSKYYQTLTYRPYWSPDGKKIVYFLSNIPRHEEIIEVYFLETGETKRYYSPDVYNFVSSSMELKGIIWSPDSNWVAYLANKFDEASNERRMIEAVNIETGELYCITPYNNIVEEIIDWK